MFMLTVSLGVARAMLTPFTFCQELHVLHTPLQLLWVQQQSLLMAKVLEELVTLSQVALLLQLVLQMFLQVVNGNFYKS
jgi:hypothetical protein